MLHWRHTTSATDTTTRIWRNWTVVSQWKQDITSWSAAQWRQRVPLLVSVFNVNPCAHKLPILNQDVLREFHKRTGEVDLIKFTTIIQCFKSQGGKLYVYTLKGKVRQDQAGFFPFHKFNGGTLNKTQTRPVSVLKKKIWKVHCVRYSLGNSA